MLAIVIACAAAVLASAQSPPTDILDRVLFLPGTSYVVMPQKQIGYGLIPPHTVTPSENGRSIAFVATAPDILVNPELPMIRGIYVHRIGSGRTSMMLRLNPDQEFIDAHWIGDRLAVQVFRAGVSELLMLGPGDNQVRNITSWREVQFVTPVEDEENPKAPAWPEGTVQTRFLGGTESVLYFLARTGATQTELWMLDSTAQLRRQRFDIASIDPSFFQVLPNGLIALQRANGDREIFNCFDPNTGRLVQFEVVEPRGFVPLEVSRPWGMSERMADRGYTLNALVLQASESDDPQLPALVTKDGVRGGVMPKQQAVWFVDSFGLYLCDLMPVETEKLEALKREAVKADAISRAKQVGIGMMIYGADYDDYLPRAGDWENAVLPYLKNRDLTNGFVYVGNGENLTNIKDPANQVLGYIDTPYGRAIVRMDSSVKWEDKPQTLALDRRWWDHRYQAARL